MTIGFALDYIEKRMQALGYGANYLLKFRHLVLQPSETRKVDAFNEYYLLIEENAEITIVSDFGFYDTSTAITNELQYEHFGKINVKNKSETMTSAKFIQVIPLNKENEDKNNSDNLKLDLEN